MPWNKVVASLDAAVADIPDGASIMLGGFGPGTPYNLIAALYRKGTKDLTLIANGTAVPRRGNIVTSGALVAEGRVKKVVMAFTGAPHPSQPSVLEEFQQAGKLEAELVPQGTLAERIRAGGAGIPAFYTPTAVGTELAAGKEHRVFNGRTYLMEQALTADYAFVRAWKADTFGNLVFRRAQRNFNPIMAMAARCTIAEIEEPIVEPGELDPDHIHTSGIVVRRIVQIPPDGVFHVPVGRVAAGTGLETARQ